MSWGPVGDDFLPRFNLTYLAEKINIKTCSLEAELMSAYKRKHSGLGGVSKTEPFIKIVTKVTKEPIEPKI